MLRRANWVQFPSTVMAGRMSRFVHSHSSSQWQTTSSSSLGCLAFGVAAQRRWCSTSTGKTPPGGEASFSGKPDGPAMGSYGAEGASSPLGHNKEEQPSYDPWGVMGLKEGASHHDVRMRYNELIKEYHPDYVPKGKLGDVEKLREVEQAYTYIIASPSIDKRYRNLVSGGQRKYYSFLPGWMARNVDEMPRYYSWVKHKVAQSSHLIFFVVLAAGVTIKLCRLNPEFFFIIAVAFIVDTLFHTMLVLWTLFLLFNKSVFTNNSIEHYNTAWLQSPKKMLGRGLQN